MTYDPLGRRHIKAVNGERTFFNWDGDALLSEQYEDQSPREYVYYPGTFEPLALIDGDGQVYYYHNDLNGLPQELTRPNGEIVWSAAYDAMGRVDQLLVEEVSQPLRFQGQYWDPEIDLCYNRYRYYDPKICSFISQDPLGLAAGLNAYAFAPNMWGWVDPLGLKCKVNIYTGTAIAFISEGSPVRNQLKPKVQGKQMVMTETAMNEFKNIVNKVGGPLEKARAQQFLDKHIEVIPDNPSQRVMNLKLTKKVDKVEDKVIFGTGDNLGITTLSNDAKFFKGAKAQGVEVDIDVHEPMPLASK